MPANDASLVIVPETAMAVGGATVRLLGLPIVIDGHGRRSVDDAVRPALHAAVERDVRQPTVRRLSSRVRCSVCGGDLFLPSRHSEKPVPVPIGDHVVTVLVETDWARCRDCGLEHIDPAIGITRVTAAMNAAIDAALTPPHP